MVWRVDDRNDMVTIKIRDEELVYNADEVTADLLRQLARDYGLSKFTVTINGQEVPSPNDFDGVNPGDVVEIVPYDVWA